MRDNNRQGGCDVQGRSGEGAEDKKLQMQTSALARNLFQT